MRPIKKDRYYIVDFRNPKSIHFYNKAFQFENNAKEAIDAYLGQGKFIIMKGDLIILQGLVPYKRTPFRKYLPKRYREGNRSPNIINARERIRGHGIIHHQFKDIWEELPTDPQLRKAHLRRGRTVIFTRILK